MLGGYKSDTNKRESIAARMLSRMAARTSSCLRQHLITFEQIVIVTAGIHHCVEQFVFVLSNSFVRDHNGAGQLAPRFEYIAKLREERERLSPTSTSAHTGDGSRTHVCLTGHLFDTSLINRALVRPRLLADRREAWCVCEGEGVCMCARACECVRECVRVRERNSVVLYARARS